MGVKVRIAGGDRERWHGATWREWAATDGSRGGGGVYALTVHDSDLYLRAPATRVVFECPGGRCCGLGRAGVVEFIGWPVYTTCIQRAARTEQLSVELAGDVIAGKCQLRAKTCALPCAPFESWTLADAFTVTGHIQWEVLRTSSRYAPLLSSMGLASVPVPNPATVSAFHVTGNDGLDGDHCDGSGLCDVVCPSLLVSSQQIAWLVPRCSHSKRRRAHCEHRTHGPES